MKQEHNIERRKLIKYISMVTATLALPIPLTSFIKYDNMVDDNNFEVIIIGGSYAGLSAAMALGRSLRNILIIDAGLPCNRFTPHSHNFLTHDGEKPHQITMSGKSQVLKYQSVKAIQDTVIGAKRSETGFELITQLGETFTTRKLLFATGLKDILPDMKGFADCWGKSVIHCPYCHGYEYHHQPTGILANGDVAYHIAQLVHNLTKEVYIFTNGKSSFREEESRKLGSRGIEIIETEVDYLEHEKGYLNKIVLKDKSAINLSAIYARPDYEQNCKIPEQLGCELSEHGLLKVDMFQKTTIQGIFACGDNCAMRSVAAAIYTGNMAGAACNAELVKESFEL